MINLPGEVIRQTEKKKIIQKTQGLLFMFSLDLLTTVPLPRLHNQGLLAPWT